MIKIWRMYKMLFSLHTRKILKENNDEFSLTLFDSITNHRFRSICWWIPYTPTMLVLAIDELKWLVSVAASPVTLVISSYFQSVKYPSLEVTVLTSISPESIATTHDIDGRNVGDAWVHKRDTPISRFTSSSLNSDNLESARSTSRLFSCNCQAWERYIFYQSALQYCVQVVAVSDPFVSMR